MFLRRSVLPAAILLPLTAALSHAEIQSGQVLVKAVSGDVTGSLTNGNLKPLKAGDYLTRGTTIKTGSAATADLILEYNGSVLRMLPDSTLELSKLDKEQAPDSIITETSLNLVSGSVVGSQRKLAAPSLLKVKVPGGTATIVGTEYVVRADGAVSVLSGAVTVTYNLPGNKGSVKVTIQAGFSFDPATGQVVPTSPDYLVNIIADIDTVRKNSLSFKTGGATVVVKPEEPMSPSGASRLPKTTDTRTPATRK
jgi:hypothetical protein